MSLSVRIFIVYMVFVGLCSYFVMHTVMEEIRPGVRQTTEETLVDTANLLAEFLREPLLHHQLQSDMIHSILSAYGERQPNATIWGMSKQRVNHRIYVTDKQGIVLLDSQNIALGQDYSRWNDVYLTLQGKYGARSSQEFDGNAYSSVMYVAAPIMHQGEIIGVVSVAKPNRSLQPYIDRTQRRLGFLSAGLVLLGLATGALFSWWFSRELRRLREYALNVSQGKRAVLPRSLIASGELRQLAQSLESMRVELDGKAYVEHYVQTLAHELKSPLAGIRAAAELLQEPEPSLAPQPLSVESSPMQQPVLQKLPMSEAQRQKFLRNIDSESLRLQHLIERLLNLARVEQQQVLQDPKPIAINSLLDDLIQSQSARIAQQHFVLITHFAPDAQVVGEYFLIHQALANLLDNALEFTPPGGKIWVTTIRKDSRLEVVVVNQGESIPDFAFPRLTERFFSLARPATGKKSTGLGLSFVQEVMTLHQGSLHLENTQEGVSASLQFPT